MSIVKPIFVVVDTGPAQAVLERTVAGVAIHIAPRSELMLRVLMEFLMTAQTVLCQGKVHLPRGLFFAIGYMKALALFAQDPGRPKELIEPESKRAKPVLQGSITLERIFSLPDMGQQAAVEKIEVLPGKIAYRVPELPCSVMAVGVAGSADGACETPADARRVHDIAALSGTRMFPPRTVAHLTAHTFFDIGVLVWIVACQVAAGAVIFPGLLSPERPAPGGFTKGPDTLGDLKFATSADHVPLGPVNTDNDLHILRLEILVPRKQGRDRVRVLYRVLEGPCVGGLFPFPEKILMALFAGHGAGVIPFKFGGYIKVALIDLFPVMTREAQLTFSIGDAEKVGGIARR